MPPKDKIIEPIDASLEAVVEKLVQQAAYKSNKSNALSVKNTAKQAAPQYVLDLGVEVQKDVNGVEMGVLENGIPFLTQRGVAKICGVARSVIQTLTQEWEDHHGDEILGKDRISFLKERLFKAGYAEKKLYIETQKDGSTHYAYPDIVCMAILEYYAFETKSPSKDAIDSFRQLAAYGLQKFIYEALGYKPGDKWKYHHERISYLKDSSPDGYWIVFNEISGVVVDLITANLTVNPKTIPDISVGLAWAAYWNENDFDQKFGSRVKYNHNYPPQYPQSASNPQPAWAYPDGSIPEFRRWFRHTYLSTKFPKYILSKANILPGGKNEAVAIGNMYQPKQITDS
ncbi:MAG: hypothetical protein KGK02_01945 [Rhodospirillales bacterium]|nr:hypothetical protein [Rhodospirillales bacterium]